MLARIKASRDFAAQCLLRHFLATPGGVVAHAWACLLARPLEHSGLRPSTVKMVFESLVVELLNKYLGAFIENLDASQLSLGVWSGRHPCGHALCLNMETIHKFPFQFVYLGTATLENLRVKEEAFVSFLRF